MRTARRSRPAGRRGAGIALAALAALAAGCGDGSTDVGSPPTALVAVSLPVDTIATSESTDPPVAVRVEDALGNPVEGAPVRFIIVRGEGELSPGVAVAGEDGVAESVYRAGPTPGEAEIQVDIPSAANVAPLRFLVLAVTADTVALSVVDGDGQRAEAGSQLPLPFLIRAETMSGIAAGGVQIAFRAVPPPGADEGAEEDEVEGEPPAEEEALAPPLPPGVPDEAGEADDATEGAPGPGAGSLTHDVIVTDGGGLGQAVFTLGDEPGDYRVDVFATGGVYSDTISFMATALAGVEGTVQLDSVGAGFLGAGARAVLFGSGFSPVPADNQVRIEGEAASVVSSTPTELTIEVPAFPGACLPQREVGVRVLVGGEPSNGLMLPMDPAARRVELGVGEALTLRGPVEVECVHFPPAAEEREFRLVVGNTGRTAARPLPLRLTTRTPANMSGEGPATELDAAALDADLQRAALVATRTDAGIRARTLAQLVEAGVAPFRPADPPPGIVAPATGDTLDVFFAVSAELTGVCADLTRPVRGAVRAVGERVILAEDVAAPAGGPGAEEWVALAERLDQTVVPVTTSYFGPLEDIDRNGRVVLLFTPEVNRLGGEGAVGAERAGTSGIGGFFLPLDLAASGRGGEGAAEAAGESCPASNEAEIIYLASADPEGSVGRPVATDRLLRDAPAIVAHELQHLISAGRRVPSSSAGFAAAEEVWLDEALSGVAEEVAGLAALELPLGERITFDDVSETPEKMETFDTFIRGNFLNLGLYLLGTAGAPTIAEEAPGGVRELQMRGFGWFLLRRLADRAGGDERAFFRSVTSGGQDHARGIANLERVLGREWADLLADVSLALAREAAWGTGGEAETDAAGAPDAAAGTERATWDARDVFASLDREADAHARAPGGFSLRAVPLGFETRVIEIDVGASNAYYFSLAAADESPALSLSIRTEAGTPADGETAEPQIMIVRTR